MLNKIRDEKYLNMAVGGRMKNLKNIKKEVDVRKGQTTLFDMVMSYNQEWAS